MVCLEVLSQMMNEAVRGQEQSLGYLGVLASDPLLAQRLTTGEKHSIYMDVSHRGNSSGHTSRWGVGSGEWCDLVFLRLAWGSLHRPLPPVC